MSVSDNVTSLKGLIQSLTPDSTSVIQGVVTNIEPLIVQVMNDEKLTLHSALLIIPEHLTERTVDAEIEDNNETKNVTLKLLDALKVGDKVYLLSFNEGKKYYILDRTV